MGIYYILIHIFIIYKNVLCVLFCNSTVPGAPSNVSFPDVTSTTARVIWDVPADPNGEILAYRINYQLHSSEGYNFSKEFPASDRTFR